MQIAELAAAHLVHPHPLPGGAEEHHLLGDVLEGADALARLPETRGRARGKVAGRRIRLRTLPGILVEIRGPVIGRELGHRPEKVRAGSRSGSGAISVSQARGCRTISEPGASARARRRV